MKKVLIVGLPFFPHKYQYVVDSYKKIGVDVKVLLNSDFVPGLSNSKFIYFAGNNKFKRVVSYFKMLYQFRPKNIDCYDYSILSIFYVLVARLLGINTRFWLIGGELNGDKQDSNKESLTLDIIVHLKMRLSQVCLRFANTIYAKEIHHIRKIEEISPRLLNKVESIYNCVPIPNDRIDFENESAKDFLYANAVIESRNVDAIINAFYELKSENIPFSASIYGFSSISNDVYAPRGIVYSEKVIAMYEKLMLQDCVQVKGFVKNIKDIMLSYKFFILPSNVILANYALLEAMSLGLVPIIYPGEGYNLIVEDGINGIVAKDKDLVKAMKRALDISLDEYKKMSDAARQKIQSDFSLDLWQQKLSKRLI